jgi:putative superfamily III holin-X
MATVHRLPTRPTPVEVEDEAVLARLTRLVKLELELGMAETRTLVRTLIIAIAVAVPAAIALIAAIVVLLAAALSPIFDARWEPLLIAGGGVALLALAALAWAARQLTHLSWPKETLTSLEENWRWLAAQLRSRLTLRSRGA